MAETGRGSSNDNGRGASGVGEERVRGEKYGGRQG